MLISNMLTLIALILAGIHFGVPLTYYWYAKKKWLKKPWNIKTDENYKPRVTIIVPTYNEAKFIQTKLDNLYAQDYPKDLIEVIVVDSASDDGTTELVTEWKTKHRDTNLRLIREEERKGKAVALNHALKHTRGKIVIIADVDATWPNNAISEIVKWFADPAVGAVSCLKKPVGSKTIEKNYRQYYNTLRIAESKAHSTPIFHGELAAFRKELLEKIGGFPTDIGADDSHTATRIALMGYRTIVPEGIVCFEYIPRKGYHMWRIRRAQHLLQHFTKVIKENKRTLKTFKMILRVEIYLHLINPWLLVVTIALLLASALQGSLTALALLLLGLVLLLCRPFRTWIATQLYLAVASLRNPISRELIWEKHTKS